VIVLTLNSGSSSLKFGLYRAGASAGEPEPLMSGEAEAGKLAATGAGRAALPEVALAGEVVDAAVGAVAKLIADARLPPPQAVGHRIVHGGPNLLQHCMIDARVTRELETARAFSPLHAPAALALIGKAQAAFPGLPQAACFDTVFHAGLPDVARTLPIARELTADGLHRYGFHGLSCESIVRQLGDALPTRLVIAHLGSGASVTAVQGGRSIDTSMGLTPSGGVIMGTRSGDLDPGVLIYLMRERGYDAARLEALIDHRSGLDGISGLSGDMRALHAAAPTNPDARLATQMFCLSVAKAIAGMVVALDGVDTLVFTGGIGEHDATAREAVGAHLRWMGVIVDENHNRSAQANIAGAGSRCRVLVLPSQEDEQIARHTANLIDLDRASGAHAASR